jgi:hypothetical protein
MWRGGRSKLLKLQLKPIVPKLPLQNIATEHLNDASCTTNQTSLYLKAWRISANNGGLRKARPGHRHHHRRQLIPVKTRAT